jgi:deoxyribose-phosphate aldolase
MSRSYDARRRPARPRLGFIQSLVVPYEAFGPRWMSPDWFRFGASSLLNDDLIQIDQQTGSYQDPDHFTLD